jgi:hypothetical protein
MLIVTPSGDPMVTADDLASAAREKFGYHADIIEVTGRNADLNVALTLPGEPPFRIRHFAHNAMLSMDGTPEQNASAAAWVRSILPPDLTVYAVDDSGSAHVLLHRGITSEEIADGWVDGLPPAP